MQQSQEDSLAVLPFPCLPLLLLASLEARRRLQELQTKDEPEVEAGRAASAAHRVSVYGHGPHRLWSSPWQQHIWFQMWEEVGGMKIGSLKGPSTGGAQSLCEHHEGEGLVDIQGSRG